MASVRVISPDWTAVRERLQSWADDLLASGPDVLGVLLYGSLARGDHAPGSDADLIVVVGASPDPPDARGDRFGAPRAGVPAEVTVYTDDELRRFLAEGLPFLTRALREGRWLATAPGWRHP